MKKLLLIFTGLVVAGTALFAAEVPKRGRASWYGHRHAGLPTASGEIFDLTKLTCASWDYAFGTRLLVTNTANGKSVVVRVNDRGPAKRLVKQGRILDLSMSAFSYLADLRVGLIDVTIKKL